MTKEEKEYLVWILQFGATKEARKIIRKNTIDTFRAVRLEERERCAKVAEQIFYKNDAVSYEAREAIAAAIREA